LNPGVGMDAKRLIISHLNGVPWKCIIPVIPYILSFTVHMLLKTFCFTALLTAAYLELILSEALISKMGIIWTLQNSYSSGLQKLKSDDLHKKCFM
jgi:hypothetical protein